jgi:hypothetical protein
MTTLTEVLTFTCLRRTLLRTTSSLSVPTDCDVMTRFVAPRYVNLEQRYVKTCVGAGSGSGGGSENNKKVNVYLPSLVMKVPDHLYVLGDTYKCHISFLCVSVVIYLTASMPVSAILVTRRV